MSWLIWIVGLGLIASIGFVCYRFGWFPLGIYCVLLLGFFNTF